MRLLKIIKAILFISFSMTLFFIRDHFVLNLEYYIPSLMMAYGIFEFLHILIKHKKEFYKEGSFYFGSIELLLGIILLVFISDFTTICVTWAIWSILRESIEIEEIVNGLLKGIPLILSIVTIIESLVVIVLSTILIINPNEETALIHSYLLSIELILTAIIPLFRQKDNNIKEEESNFL